MGVFSKGSNMISETNITVIAKNTEFQGELTCEGIVQIDGKYDGKIVANGSIIIGTDGKVNGEFFANEIVVNGELYGKIDADKVRIGEKGRVRAIIVSEVFAISEGGVFEGEKKFKLKKDENKDREYIDMDTDIV